MIIKFLIFLINKLLFFLKVFQIVILKLKIFLSKPLANMHFHLSFTLILLLTFIILFLVYWLLFAVIRRLSFCRCCIFVMNLWLFWFQLQIYVLLIWISVFLTLVRSHLFQWLWISWYLCWTEIMFTSWYLNIELLSIV